MNKLHYSSNLLKKLSFLQNRFSLINILGFSIGLAASLLILIYVHFETSFDAHNPNAKNIYRVVEKRNQDGSVDTQCPLPLSVIINRDYAEVKDAVGVSTHYRDIKVNDIKFTDISMIMTEKEFFEVFNYPLLVGDIEHVFDDANSVVITNKLATKIYGEENPIGQTLELSGKLFTIQGIIDEIPSNSLFDFDVVISDKYRYEYYADWDKRWWHGGLYAFLTFEGNVVPDGFEGKLNGVQKRYYPDYLLNRHEYALIPFKQSHLNSALLGDLKPSVSAFYLWLLGGIAFCILAIASFNFINISIAVASKRHKETAIKKLNGATSLMVMKSFFMETFIVVGISLVIAAGVLKLILPLFSQLVEKEVRFNMHDPFFLIGLLLFGAITILLAGSYPAFYLSKPTPGEILRSRTEKGASGFVFRKAFVITQFVITISLVTGLMFMMKQVRFLKEHELGFEKENLMSLSAMPMGNSKNRLKNAKIFIDELNAYKSKYEFSNASITEFIPGFGYRNYFKIFPEGLLWNGGLELKSAAVDANFANVFRRKIIHGRFFNDEMRTDRNAVLINETAFKKFGWDNLNDKFIALHDKNKKVPVVGVINDINIQSLQHPVQPMIYRFGPYNNYPEYVTWRINQLRREETLAFFKEKWELHFPEVPFEPMWIEERFEMAYGEEEKLVSIVGLFAGMALILSMLGIAALSIIYTEKRIKEIGIRKVNGAKIPEILNLLNGEYIKWIALSFIIAIPVIWYLVVRWLENFAYQTNISWWIFLLAGLLVVMVSIMIVSWKTLWAARRNPVEALRYE